jgi:predicted secreted Zn-dependent protease
MALKDLWKRFVAGRRAAEIEHTAEVEQMSPAEREATGERFEDRQADLESEAHLGGIDPKRLLGD